MRILLPITLRSTGGTSTFARKFQKAMQERGHDVVFSPQKPHDVLLASPRAPLPLLLAAKKRNIPIIQRLDGVYYPAVAGATYPLHNASIWYIRKYFSTALIYQSKFSKQSCDRYLGKSTLPSQLIYNGVDTELFTPKGPSVDIRETPRQHVFITASRFRRKDQILPLLKAFRLYQESHAANSKLIVIGNFEHSVKNIPEIQSGNSGVLFLGAVPHAQLTQYLRAADAFVFTHRNPPCPNNVIEALASGLPICGIADGSMSELITPGVEGELVHPDSDEFAYERKINLEEFARNMAKILSNQKQYSAAARHRALSKFRIKDMADAYHAIITRTAS